MRCWPGKQKVTGKHLGPLNLLAQELNATQYALENAKRLGRGYGDLVVVLLEPSDKAELVPYDEMLASSVALQFMDVSLHHASRGRRNIHNTIVLDIRPFRSARIRSQQTSEEERSRDDEIAYKAFEGMLRLLNPDVILVCQCETEKNKAEN
ncbi:hypothetical protein VTN77DRAFT_7515 [Rasamsonia byssochlamydoides]|uniref:uncharacterized protein n=1 Tax=Rasamsonia byssochlamydoides TaxID=89139 RepID=UPI0037428EBD